MKQMLGCHAAAWALAILAGTSAYASTGERPAARPRWAPETLRLAATLPIQDGGRVKPLDTFARVMLLRFNGKRSCEDRAGKRVGAMAWLLDTLFFPETAQSYTIFRVDNPEVATALGLPVEQERNRYAYNDLLGGREKLRKLAEQYSRAPAQDRSPFQSQIVNLAANVHDFESLCGYLSFASHTFSKADIAPAAGLLPAQEHYGVGELVRAGEAIVKRAKEIERGSGPGAAQALDRLFGQVDVLAAQAQAMALFPPLPDASEDAWLAPGDVIAQGFLAPGAAGEHLAMLDDLTSLVAARTRPREFHRVLEAFHRRVVHNASGRGQYAKIPLEVLYNRFRPFYWGLVLYVAGFLAVALSWLSPQNRGVRLTALTAVLVPTGVVAAGIVMRCIIRGRPPVTTLYETILFSTLVAAGASLVVAWVHRERVSVGIGAALGVLGLFFAHKYEITEAADTMPSMVAVLDANFWLATHVTSIVVGYAAGLLAAALGHAYVIGRALGLKRGQDSFYPGLSRMVYGTLCFGLLFSVLGTVLGGIWASESWGRFWGWDPKENGALMIVLWQLAILHARSGGYVRDFGTAMGAVFGGGLVVFSWFGINLLGVGLHSYGFSDGTFTALTLFYVVEACVVLVGVSVWLRDRRRGRSERAHAA